MHHWTMAILTGLFELESMVLCQTQLLSQVAYQFSNQISSAHINDIPPSVHCEFAMFAEDIKLWARMGSTDGCMFLWKDLDTVFIWSVEKEIPLYLTECVNIRKGLTSQTIRVPTNMYGLGSIVTWMC